MDKTENAKRVYNTMVVALKKADWKFEEKPEKLTIVSNYRGEDLPINFIIAIDAEREVILFYSPMPFKIEEDKRREFSSVICAANYGLVNGSFDFDLRDGEIRFRLTTSYCGCLIGEDFFMDMLATAVMTTDKYNDKFMMVSKGYMTVDKFIEEE